MPEEEKIIDRKNAHPDGSPKSRKEGRFFARRAAGEMSIILESSPILMDFVI